MTPSTTPDIRGSLVAGLLAPLRFPARVADMVVTLADAAGDVATIRTELTHVRKQTQPLADLMPAVDRVIEEITELLPLVRSLDRQAQPLAELLPALARMEERLGTRLDSLHEVVRELETQEDHLNTTVDRLVGELAGINHTVSGLEHDIEGITERLPNPNAGPLEKARVMLSGRGE